MKKNNTLYTAQKIINNKNDNSKYYRELLRAYNEYKSIDTKDKVLNDLYLEHINDLCNIINIKKKSNISLIVMLLVLVITIGFTGYSTYKYFDISNNLKNNIIKINKGNSLIINYKNIDDFVAITLSDEDEYINLKPLTLSIYNHSKDNKKMEYNIYIIEDNASIDDDKLLDKDVFLYNIENNNTMEPIQKLREKDMVDGKIKIYTGVIDENSEIKINLRMWIDEKSDTDYLNKVYRFKIFVDGIVI